MPGNLEERKIFMSETPNTLNPLSSEDFDAMMGEGSTDREIVMPFGFDVMLVLPEGQEQSNNVCGVDTGTGDNEDEYPPRFDPSIEGSVDDLQ